ncbi:hypothetical protein HDV01_007655 [Terramyces sp. JEL0728]|nr:hypothetical protein HDV01_007655 [Terramyces sp. JEL0728]
MELVFLLTAVAAKLALTTEWTEQNSCSGPPNYMYQFDLRSPDAFTAPVGEQWPVGYIQQATERPISTGCLGITVKVPFVGACCAQFLGDIPSTAGTSSSITEYISDTPSSAVPESATGNTYCYLQGKTSASVFGFNAVWYLADGTCAKDSLICTPEGNVSIFPNLNCQGNPQTYNLSVARSITVKNKVVGDGSLVTFNGTGLAVGWTISVPLSQMSPDFTNPLIIFTASVYCMIFLLMVYGIYFLAKEYLTKRTGYMLGSLVCQTAWTATLVLLGMNDFPKFEYDTFTALAFCTINIATVISVITVTAFLFQFLGYSDRVKYATYTCIIVVNAIAASSRYLFFIKNFPNRVLFNRFNMLWFTFFAFWDCFPPVYVSFSLLKINSDSLSKRARKLVKYDPWFFAVMLLNLLLVVSYICYAFVREYTSVLKTDRNWTEFQMIAMFILSIHCMLNLYLIIRLRIFVKKRSMFSSSDDYHLSGPLHSTSRVSQSTSIVSKSALPAPLPLARPSTFNYFDSTLTAMAPTQKSLVGFDSSTRSSSKTTYSQINVWAN